MCNKSTLVGVVITIDFYVCSKNIPLVDIGTYYYDTGLECVYLYDSQWSQGLMTKLDIDPNARGPSQLHITSKKKKKSDILYTIE